MSSIEKLRRQCDFQYGKLDSDKTLYFITITIRRSKELCKTALSFATLLYEKCDENRYPQCLLGKIEYSDKFNGYHFHGLTNWKYKHFGAKTNVFALVKPITTRTMNNVIDYILKGDSIGTKGEDNGQR